MLFGRAESWIKLMADGCSYFNLLRIRCASKEWKLNQTCIGQMLYADFIIKEQDLEFIELMKDLDVFVKFARRRYLSGYTIEVVQKIDEPMEINIHLQIRLWRRVSFRIYHI